MSDLSETPASLLIRLRRHQDEAWNRFKHVYRPVIAWWCLNYSITTGDIDDFLEEVFQTIFMKIPSFNGQSCYAFRGWLKTVTLTKCRDYHHGRGRSDHDSADALVQIQRESDQIDPVSFVDSSVAQEALSKEQELLLTQVFELVRNEFVERDVRIFYDLIGFEMQPAAVAAKYEVPVNTVQRIKCKFLAKIKTEFGDILDFESNQAL